MSDRHPVASFLVRWLVLATVLFALSSTAAHALIRLPGGFGGGGVIVIGPGGVFDPGGGGGGGGISFHAADLIARGYVCRPYSDGVSGGQRCDANFIDQVTFIATLDTQRCDPNDSCGRRATKPAPGKVGDGMSLWSLFFPAAAKFAGFGDVNGDGKDDVIGFSDLHASVGHVRVALSNGTNEFSQVPQLWATSFCGGASQVCQIGDFNGDHKSDIASFDRSNGQVSVAVSNGSAFVDARVWNSTFAGFNGTILVGDFDGDGDDDVATILPSGSTAGPRGTVLVSRSVSGPPVFTTGGVATAAAALPATTGTTGTTGAVATSLQLATTAQLATAPVVAAAVVTTAPLTSASTVQTAQTAITIPGGIGPIGGSGGPPIFAAPTQWIGPLCPDPNECVVGDFNGDGKADIARVRSTGESYVAISTGSAFLGEVNWSNRLGNDPRSFRAVDMNGDGKDDLVAIQGDGSLTVGISDGTFFVANVDVANQHCGDTFDFACKFANLDGDKFPELIEISSFAVANSSDGTTQSPGDTFVSKGSPVRGFDAAPARPVPADTDGDGIRDGADDCILVSNADQADTDADGVGDACELVADLNGDGVVNVADLVILRSKFFTKNAAADLNHDGIVNLGDVALLKREFLKPSPSATVGPPVIDLVSPRHGTFYDPGTQRIRVAGFVRNVASSDGQVVVHSQTFQNAPVDTTFPIAADGFFDGFIPIDTTAVLNPVVAEVTRTSTGVTGAARVMALFGPSVDPGDFSLDSLGARIEAWQLDEFVEDARKKVDLAAVAAGAKGGEVKNVTITGPLALTARPFSDLLTFDLGFPAMTVAYEDFLTGCNFNLSMTNVTAHIAYNLEPRQFEPSKVEAREQTGSPAVNFGSFSHDQNIACDALAKISFTDIEKKAKDGIAGALRARDFGAGPIDGKIEDTVNGIDLSQVLTDLSVVIGTRFHAVTEDVLGIGVDIDTAFGTTTACGTSVCHPPLTSATQRVFQTQAAHPPIPLLVPNGGGLFDLAVSLSADSINQLFGSMMASGKLTSLLSTQEKDIATSNPPDPATDAATASIIKKANLTTKLKFVPTLAPILTGKPGLNGGTEVELGQVLLEIETLDGSDAFTVAADVKGAVDLSLAARPILFQLPGQPPPPLTLLRIHVHDLELLAAQTVHIPATVNPAFEGLFFGKLAEEVETTQINVDFPLPDFAGFGLTLLDLSQDPNGGAVVFGKLDLNPPPGGGGGGIGGGVLTTQ